MELQESQILVILEEILSIDDPSRNLVQAGHIKNIQIFSKKIFIDLIAKNPSLAIRKKLELSVMKIIHQKIDSKIEVLVQCFLEKQETKTSPQASKPSIAGIKNILAISSGKGGVGKSTLTVNLAISLQKLGFSVGILDADIYGPSIPIMLDVEFEKPLTENDTVNKSKIKPVISYGILVLSIGFFVQTNQAVAWRGPMVSKALHQMIYDTVWGELDYLLIDFPPGTGDIHLSMVQSIPITGAVIISTPQKIALAAAHKGVSFYQMEAIEVPVLGIIENMAYFITEDNPDQKHYIFGKQGAYQLSNSLGIPFLGEVPLVQRLRESSDIGYPLALQTNNPLANIFKKIAQEIILQLEKRNEKLPPTQITPIINDKCPT